MTDTPQHIYDLQLKLWLAKSPAERLNQLMMDNDALFKFWKEAKIVNNSSKKVLLTKKMFESNSKK